MNEAAASPLVRETSHPGSALVEAQSNGCGLWLILDPDCHPDALRQLYAAEPDSEKTLLFLDSPLEYLHQLSPRFAETGQNPPILDWLEHNTLPGWGMVLASNAPAIDVLAHLRSLLLVKSGAKEVVFRVWDGRIVHRICAALPEETPLLLGPIRRIVTRTEDGAWACIDREKNPFSGPLEPVPARPCPWYAFTQRHAEVFRDKRLKTIARNLTEALMQGEEGQGVPMPLNELLLSFVSRHAVRAESLGLQSQESIALFVRCCLLLGEGFPADCRQVLKIFGRRPVDEDAAIAAMLPLARR
jgi:hypothetical protein